LLERSEDRGQVALRSSSGPELVLITTPSSLAMICASVVLPKPGGPYNKHVVERFAPAARRLDGDFDVFLHTRLADVIGEALRADARVNPSVFIERRAGHDAWQRFLIAARFPYPNSLVTSPALQRLPCLLLQQSSCGARALLRRPLNCCMWRAAMPQTDPGAPFVPRVRQPASAACCS